MAPRPTTQPTTLTPGAPAGSWGRYETSKVLREVGFGLLVVLVGSAATYFAESVAPTIDQSTTVGLAVAAVLRISVEIARRWLTDNTKKVV